MTSELKPGIHTDEFVNGRPKNYAYRTANPATGERESVCKVRGITLNFSTSKLVNCDVIRHILRADESEKLWCTQRLKLSERAGGRIDIISEPEDKMYRVSYFKRRRLVDNTSIPFGYINGC
jgi:hypothetical protein